MEYNTTQKKLILPEYGRNVQMMAEHLLTIENRQRRTEAAHELVAIMTNMNPLVKETKDYKQKIWDFLAELCEHKLDIDFPYPITKASELPPPDKLEYNTSKIKFRHYGLIIERLIEAASKFEDGPDKDVLIKMIANHMKKTYIAWNQKSVNDSIIINDLYKLSHGKLNLSEETKLMHVSVAKEQNNNHNNKKHNNKQKNNKQKNNKRK
ncbi:MAG TPA: DUF4290 domain-containing protein [Bacteroidales bacterium]|nr:DUF4290 domain-containing protein [Bacteroidales bacterium]